jgi:asparagine synthetase B (glutamine-hydrolysing)
MCGIYGYFGRPKKGKENRVLRLYKELAIESMVRGTDATGIFACSDENYYIHKLNISADEFIEDDIIHEAIVDDRSYVVLGHNRAASIGTIKDSLENAHPFEGERFVQVHNGSFPPVKQIAKHLGLYKDMEGDTDSEAICKIVNHYSNNNNLNKSMDFFRKLQSYSLVYFDKYLETIYFLRDPGRPMYIANMKKSLGITVFVSTQEILHKALKSLGYKKFPKGFQTKTWHLYLADPKTKKIENDGKYATIAVEKAYQEMAEKRKRKKNKKLISSSKTVTNQQHKPPTQKVAPPPVNYEEIENVTGWKKDYIEVVTRKNGQITNRKYLYRQ